MFALYQQQAASALSNCPNIKPNLISAASPEEQAILRGSMKQNCWSKGHFFGSCYGSSDLFGPHFHDPCFSKKRAERSSFSPLCDAVHCPKRDMVKTPNFLLLLSINSGSIKEVVPLWLTLCILMQVPHFVVPTGSKSRRLQRKHSSLPPSLLLPI